MFKWLANFTRSIVNEAVDKAIERVARDMYTENLMEMIPVAKKVGPIAMMEIIMRASQGKPPGRPLGSHIQFSPWEKFLLNPVHLSPFPTPDSKSISSSVTIGKKAKKPLVIDLPIMVAAMSYGGALSKSSKIALAKAATLMGTATNTGETGLLEEERAAAGLLIGQYNRGGWLNTPEKYSRLDAIEIQLGQGAQGSSPQRTKAENIGPEYREVYGLKEGEDAVIHSRLPGVDTKEQFLALVKQLREETGVPVGLKIAATHHLERELDVAIEAGVDFITVDGAEGGTHAAAPTLEDDLGLPTIFAISRAAKHLEKRGVKERISLIGTGGIVSPGQVLKALAFGADAVYMGTAIVLAMVGDQMTKTLPFEAPTSLAVYNAKMTDKLDIDRSVQNIVNFLKACKKEMELVAYSLGKQSLSELDLADLCTLDPFLSIATGVQLGYIAPEEQADYFNNIQQISPLPLEKRIPDNHMIEPSVREQRQLH